MATRFAKTYQPLAPKPAKPKRYLKRGGKIGAGKKTNRWNYVRQQLKTEFTRKGIYFCEICGTTEALSMAHRLKRRFITDDQELRTVAILCLRDHEIIEKLPHQEMFDRITEIIQNRELETV